jgi:hypothetical protein
MRLEHECSRTGLLARAVMALGFVLVLIPKQSFGQG